MNEAAGGPTIRQLREWGLDPAWSQVVEFETADGRAVSWHVLDNGAEPVHGTLVCTHGNPTWSYIWHEFLALAPEGWRVVAVDQSGMGFSNRGTPRVLSERIDELVAFCQAHTDGPIVMAAHDWGGPITVGAAARLDCRALVLTNTAVALPDGVKVPPLIAAARSAVRVVCEQTPVFVEGTAQMTRREHRAALRAPYRSRARRHAVAEFVADIPVGPDDPSWTALVGVAEAFGAMTFPILLAWGGRDPVFHERFLADLQQRAPHAQVQVFPEAAHLVTLDAPVAEVAWEWLADLDAPEPEPEPEPDAEPEDAASADVDGFRPVTAALVEHADDTGIAFSGPGGTRTWRQLADHARHIARRLLADGLAPGDRVALLVPPSADCLAAAYGIWMAGGVVVAVDSQLGLRPMRRLLRGATVQWSIGTDTTVRLARALGLTPGATHLVVPPAPTGGAAFTATTTALPVLAPEALAAVVHTSGATGPAKPVRYTHAALAAQRDTLLGQFPIGAFTTSFAPFMLVGPALGLACSLPDDVTPGALDFDAFAAASAAAGTTTAWLSPAAAQRIADTAAGRTAPMELVMLAGAPVLPALADAVAGVTAADVRAPYGMTEALPLTDGTSPAATGPHGGTCTGRPLVGVEVVIDELEPGTGWGEILVSAAWMRAGYDRRWALNRAATTVIDGRAFHRTGDVGYLDDGRLFQLGRRMHVITAAAGPLACVVPEQQVLAGTGRTAAAVGVGPAGTQVLVVVVDTDTKLGLADLATTAAVRAACATPVAAVLTGPLPVDVRHRTKVDRVALAADATSLLAGR